MKRGTWLLALAAVALAACSSGGSGESPSSSSPPPTGPPLYTDPNYGFSVTYAEPFKMGTGQGIQTLGQPANNPAATSVMFYDTSQKLSSKQASPSGAALYPVSLTVSVFPLPEPVTPENLAEAKLQVEHNIVPQLTQPGMSFSPVTQTTLAGRPALTTTATQKGPGIPSTTKLYYVFDDSNEYQVATQLPTSLSAKMQPTLNKMLQSFTVPGTWPSASPSGSASALGSPSVSATPSPSATGS